ncbi:hypothetical protein [Phaeodactylibacter xiamenensis]|jgi:hypothetical protein|uniref:hypothetical protein n=1 Tax=Phaeodactylibacter xiamenensis TaxID=1524460 RepID=UPI0024A98C0A|nr:hypothetical protein [Phaeodactylibacter xiamenensis]
MKNASLVFLILSVLLWPSCESQETGIRLTSSERIRIDSLAKKQIDSLVPVLDSLCTVNKDKLIEQALDSIIELRQQEEQTLRERIMRKQQQQ